MTKQEVNAKIAEAISLFKFTKEEIQAQYLRNAQLFEKMYNTAYEGNRKVCGWTADQLAKKAQEYYQLAGK